MGPVEVTTETAKAVQEVAKTAGKGIDAATAMGGFIANYVRGPVEQGLGIFEDKLRYARWERQQRLMQRAEAFLAERGLKEPPNGLPLKFAVPLLQAASLEDDDNLQDLWAHLLVNASVEPEIASHRMFVNMLENMSSLDARVLLVLKQSSTAPHDAIITGNLPASAPVWRPEMPQSDAQPSEEVLLSLANLDRLGAITGLGTAGGGTSWVAVHVTILGRKLIDACSAAA
ncbi:Abi-alpha family protein [Paraburkholderia bryophila]|uniref:DUF4393 domain-containing protein n=1 Tax=Paraburkholderia bryophila TaxID=420952 RepID=A0A7Y9WMC8_9BURK|nr:Abi-alpha family protein [Paraburkholderia bryophila]NYH22861.1 hypothetical protein [Paraburkholderia bryophila]